MKLKLHSLIIAILLGASLLIWSGCASIVSKSNYPVSISSTPPGAKVTITDQRGVDIYVGNTPAMCTLKSGRGFFAKAGYLVTFEMEGYQKRVVAITTKLDGWYFGNIFFGGLIGLLIVDPATGAMWKLDSSFINEMLVEEAPLACDHTLQIFDYNDIPESWKDKLVALDGK